MNQSGKAILISGIGGQGIVFAGRLLARAWFSGGNHVALRYAYGAEVMGTTVHSEVVVSPRPILFPYLETADVAVVLHASAAVEVLARLVPGALFVTDEAVGTLSVPDGVRVEVRPFIAATTKGRPGDPGRASPIAALGFLAKLGIVDLEILTLAAQGEPGSEENRAALLAGFSL